MNKNINLCEILKGHEGETFYSPVFGIAILKEMTNNYLCLKSVDKVINLYKDGRYDIHGECMLFPSKDQRDWNKWLKEQKSKVPKTWSELYDREMVDSYDLGRNGEFHVTNERFNSNEYLDNITPIEKSALVLLKIHQLIEVGYGGNVITEEWKNIDRYKYIISATLHVESKMHFCSKNHIAFHTKEQAEEFLSYPENVQLLKDYFMI